MAKILSFTLALFVSLSLASAMIVNSVDYDQLVPGGESSLRIDVKNTLDNDVEDASLVLSIPKTSDNSIPISFVGSSEDSQSEVQEGDTETFIYTIKASSDAKAGEYILPYTLTFKNDTGSLQERSGYLGITIEGNPELSFTANTENNIVGQQGKISVNIINKGFGDAKFVSIRISPEGYTLLSEDSRYIGSVASDDFETETFDVKFNRENPILIATIEYKDFNNIKKTQTINLPLTVYSNQKALEIGIIQKSYTFYYIILAILVVLIWFVWRTISKRRKLKRSMQLQNQGR